MNSPNAHIEKFLDYFFALLHSPEYAVMLKGPWGCGKTWFINRYCEKLEREGKKHLYISLHGIGSFAEINDAIFEQLHPVLSSKGMALAGKILKGLLKTTLKIDLSQEGHSNMSIKSQVPDFSITDLPDYLKDTSRHLLIFDDLERCRINISDVLGYINQFVEHHGYKVIIIANEDEINKIERTNEESSTQFKRINEKLIGKTFLILSDVNALLNDTISTILNKRVKDFIDKNKELIIEIYQDSTYENLRQLKQSLWDFERFMIEMPPKAWEKEPLLEHMLSLFLAYSFEIKSGTILANEIGRVKSTYYTDLVLKQEHKDKEISKYNSIRKKYKNVMLHDTVMDEKCWEDIFVKGVINRESIEQSILNSGYFQDENTPNWVKLWHFTDLSDGEYTEILKNIEEEYYDKQYEDMGIIKHITSTLLFLSEAQLYDKTKDEILKFAKTYVDHLINHNKLSLEPKEHLSFLDQNTWGGLGFWGKEIPEFVDFVDYLDRKSNEARIARMPDVGENLIEIMQIDTPLLGRMVTLSDTPDQKYYDIPVLNHMDPKEFVEAFLKLKPMNRRMIGYIIKKRYQFRDINKILIEECNWWKEVLSIFIDKRDELRGKVSGYVVQTFIQLIDNLIKELKNTSSE